MGFGGDLRKDRFERGAVDPKFIQRRFERVRRLNEKPWGEFLLGILIRTAAVFAVAWIVISLVLYLRR